MDGCLFVYWFWYHDTKQKKNRRLQGWDWFLEWNFVGKSHHKGLARLSTQTFESLRNGILEWFQYSTCKKFVFVTITTLNF